MGYGFDASITYNPAIKYILTWHALTDACPKCQHLNGQEYQDQDIFQETLWDPIWGNIWDFITDHTLAHPNCRCQLEVRVLIDWSQSPEIQQLAQILPTVELTSEWLEVDNVTQIIEFRQAISDLKTELNSLTMSYRQVHEVELSLNRIFGWLQEAAGTKDVARVYSLLQKVVGEARMLHLLIIQIQTVSGPVGWLLLGTTAIATAITAGSIMQEIGNH